MSLAEERERRSTAGNRLAKVLNEEDDDEFYKTKYGGFSDHDNDIDYQEEKEVEDVTDSDISIDEDDELKSDDDEPQKKRKKGLFTKSYKEPKPMTSSTINTTNKEKKTIVRRTKSRSLKLERKSIRRSTAAKSAATRERVQTRIEKETKRKMRRRPREERKLTQEELLKEAKLTEAENLKSLEKFQKLELEKKKIKTVRRPILGPIIRYHSTTMPVIRNVKTEVTKCERTLITFESEEDFNKVFSRKRPERRQKYCPITRVKARYFDPVTNLPFSDIQAFYFIRQCYYRLLEEQGDRNDPKIAAWLKHTAKEVTDEGLKIISQRDGT